MHKIFLEKFSAFIIMTIIIVFHWNHELGKAPATQIKMIFLFICLITIKCARTSLK